MGCCLLPVWHWTTPKSKGRTVISIPSWALKWIKSSCWNQTRVSSAKGNIACFPHSIPPPLLCFLITLPLTSGGEKKEKNGFQLAGQSFFSLLARQVPPSTNLLGPWTLYSPNSPQIHLLFLSNLSQHAFALCSTKVHDWNYRLSMNETWGGTSQRWGKLSGVNTMILNWVRWGEGGNKLGTNLVHQTSNGGCKDSVQGN